MISILIPVYNFDVVEFVYDLQTQARDCNIPFEILCYDDASREHFKRKNRILKELNDVVYKELGENLGRSKIRNKLAREAQYEYLLFADCDSTTTNSTYISTYINHIRSKNNPKDCILYGGRTYTSHPPASKTQYLSWYYGVKKEIVSAKEREINPYLNFKTNNFLISKSLFLDNSLNENLEGYGHEDTLFGLKLMEKGVPILHIDNPLCHIGLVDNIEFIEKTDEGVENMVYLIRNGYANQDIKLFRYYHWVQKLQLTSLLRFLFLRNKEQMKNNLVNNFHGLRYFDLYKLGLLLEKMAY